MKTGTVILILIICGQFCKALDESLIIGPGDKVHIKVFDTPELDEDVRVTDAGTIDLILGGSVNIAGLSPDGAAHVIEKALRDGRFMNSPHVTLTVEQYATQNVSVLGQVRSPGSYAIETPRTIIDVLAMAGGLTELADRQITIQRHGSKKTARYFLSNDSRAALSQDMLVYPGDRVLVPRAEIVYVLGDVGRPGGYPRSTNDSELTVLQAISLAGGAAPTAKSSHTRLIRRNADGTYVEMELRLSDMEKGKRRDIALHGNDIIYVPFSYARNIAIGATGIIAAAGSAAIYVH